MYFYEFISQIDKYFEEKEYEKTIELLLNVSFMKDVNLCLLYSKTALCYELLNDEKNAEKYYNIAKDFIDEKEHYYDISVLNNFVEYFYKKENYEDALKGLEVLFNRKSITLKTLILELKIYEKTNLKLFKEKLNYLFQINPFAEELIDLYTANNLNNNDDSFLINKFEELKSKKEIRSIFYFIENFSLLSEKEFDFYSNVLNKVGISVDSFIIHFFDKYGSKTNRDIIIYVNILSKFEKEKLNEIAKTVFKNDSDRVLFAKILLQIDKEYYSEFIKDFILKSTLPFNDFINLLNDIEFYKKFTIDCFKSEKLSEQNLNSIITFLENDKKDENFYLLINELERKYYYSSYSHISENLLKDLPNFEFTDFYKKVFEICFIANKEGTLKTLLGKNYEFESKNKLFEFLNINKSDIIAFFIENHYKSESKKHENEHIKAGLNYFLKNNFTEVIKQINKLEKSKIAYFIDLLWSFNKEKTFKIIFDFIQFNTKPILRRVYNIFSKYEEGFESYKSLLNEQKKDIYELGIRILSKFRNDETDKVFNKLLLDENRYEFIKLTEDYFETKKLLKENVITLKEVELLEALHSESGREKSIHIKDINVKTLPNLRFKHTNKVVDFNIILYLFKLASKTNKVVPIGKLVDYCSLIEKESGYVFAKEVYSRWNTENKTIWFLKFVSLLANDELGNIIKKDIIDFTKSSRWLVASNITPILGYIKTDKSIDNLKTIISSVTSEKVIQAANRAIKNIKAYFAPAKIDWYDLIIPDYGFDNNGILNFNYKNRPFKITIDSQFKIKIEDDKYIYNKLPKPSSNDKERLIASKINKMIKEIPIETESQISKFEYHLYKGKLFNLTTIKILLKNHLMNQIMSKLIWGYYEKGKLIKSFAIDKSNLFIDYNNTIVNFEDNYYIGIVHPVELTDEELTKWNDFLINKNINQPFKQLNRLTFEFSENEKNIDFINSKKFTLLKFKEILLNNNYEINLYNNEFIFEKYVESYKTLIELHYKINAKKNTIEITKIVFYKNGTKTTDINKILYSETIFEIIK